VKKNSPLSFFPINADRSVSKVSRCGLNDRSSFLTRTRDYYQLHVRTGSVAHSASCIMGTVGSVSRRKADHFSPFNSEVKNLWNFASTPPYIFMAWLCSTRTTVSIYHIHAHDLLYRNIEPFIVKAITSHERSSFILPNRYVILGSNKTYISLLT